MVLKRCGVSGSSSESAAGSRLLLCEFEDADPEVVRCLLVSSSRLYKDVSCVLF